MDVIYITVLFVFYLIGCILAPICIGYADAIIDAEKEDNFPLWVMLLSWLFIILLIIFFLSNFGTKLYKWSYDKFKNK